MKHSGRWFSFHKVIELMPWNKLQVLEKNVSLSLLWYVLGLPAYIRWVRIAYPGDPFGVACSHVQRVHRTGTVCIMTLRCSVAVFAQMAQNHLGGGDLLAPWDESREWSTLYLSRYVLQSHICTWEENKAVSLQNVFDKAVMTIHFI